MIKIFLRYIREGRNLTLCDTFDRYLKTISIKKKNGAKQEKSLVKAWAATNIYHFRLNKIRPMHISKIRDQWLLSRSPSTVVRRLAILSHCFTIATKDWGFESLSNPVKGIRKPVVRNARDRRLIQEPNEIELILSCAKSIFLRPVVMLALETAMRRSEIIGLKWKHVFLDDRYVHLPDTKNGKPRDVPLSVLAVNILKSLNQTSDDRVFPVSAGAITRAFSRAIKRAENKHGDSKLFKNLRFHDLRHEAISRMAHKFQSHELAKITGHSDTRMLMRYYHPDVRDLAKRL